MLMFFFVFLPLPLPFLCCILKTCVKLIARGVTSRVTCCYVNMPVNLKGHWTSTTSSPIFSKNNCDFYTIRSVGMGYDCMLSFTS